MCESSPGPHILCLVLVARLHEKAYDLLDVGLQTLEMHHREWIVRTRMDNLISTYNLMLPIDLKIEGGMDHDEMKRVQDLSNFLAAHAAKTVSRRTQRTCCVRRLT